MRKIIKWILIFSSLYPLANSLIFGFFILVHYLGIAGPNETYTTKQTIKFMLIDSIIPFSIFLIMVYTALNIEKIKFKK